MARLDLHWWQPPKEWSRARHRVRCIPPSLKCFPLCKPKRHGYNQHHLTCRASSYSSCSHTRLLTYSHRQPYITAPNQKGALTTESPSPLHPRRCPSIHGYSNCQSPSTIHFFKVKSHAGIIGNEHADALAKKSATTYSDLAEPPSKQQALKEIPSTTSTGLQKKT